MFFGLVCIFYLNLNEKLGTKTLILVCNVQYVPLKCSALEDKRYEIKKKKNTSSKSVEVKHTFPTLLYTNEYQLQQNTVT